jgi:Ca2+-binding RTX toxin-like protein
MGLRRVQIRKRGVAVMAVVVGCLGMPHALAAPSCFGVAATKIGTEVRDVIKGTPGRDVIVTLGGSDTVQGRGGDDLVCTGAKGDRVLAGPGADRVDGGAGNDRLEGEEGSDRLYGRDDNDRLLGGQGADFLSTGPAKDRGFSLATGGEGSDTIVAVSGRNDLIGGSGDDRVLSGSGRDFVDGGDGDDSIESGANSDDLEGGAGDDRLRAGADADSVREGPGNDSISGEKGSDSVSYASKKKGGVAVDLSAGTATGWGKDSLTNVERVAGTRFEDRLAGSAAANVLFGLGEADELRGRDGRDTLWGSGGSDSLNGGKGRDLANYKRSNGVVVNLQSGSATGEGRDSLVKIEDITGSYQDDLIVGDAHSNRFRGFYGGDVLRGSGGKDTLWGGPSENDENVDRMDGGPGNDFISGGGFGCTKRSCRNDRDEVDFSTSAVAITANLRKGRATGDGNDVLKKVEDIRGSAQDDVLTGNEGINEIAGSAGNDKIFGLGGEDELESSPGDDDFDGGEGIDVLQFNTAATPAIVDLGAGTSTGVGNDTIVAIENVAGSIHADTIIGDDEPNILRGGIGDDVISGAAGDDKILGGAGGDDLAGDGGGDIINSGSDADTAFGGDGNDFFTSRRNDTDDDDSFTGDAGDDTIDYSVLRHAVTVDLTAGSAIAYGTDQLATIEGVMGTSFTDVLRGDGVANRFYGGQSVDQLYGLAGDDLLQGGRGSDALNGGDGNDAASFADSSTGVTADLQAGLAEGFGADNLILIENVFGSPFSDFLRGDDAANTLHGERGDDVLEGRAGDDALRGGPGVDNISGGLGVDQCAGEILLGCE